MFLYHRMTSGIPKRRIFDVVRCNFCSDLKLTNVPSEFVNKPSTYGSQNEFATKLRKFEKNIAKYSWISFREVDRLLDAPGSGCSLNESQALTLLKCCG